MFCFKVVFLLMEYYIHLFIFVKSQLVFPKHVHRFFNYGCLHNKAEHYLGVFDPRNQKMVENLGWCILALRSLVKQEAVFHFYSHI